MASTRSVTAPGRLPDRLAEEAVRFDVRRWAVIGDRGFAESGGLDHALSKLPAGLASTVGLVGEDPDVEVVEQLHAAASRYGAEGVIAVGGGSGLCAGKAVAIRLTNPPPLATYAGRDRLLAPPAPCVAVPTTAGSGSEVSEVVILHRGDAVDHLTIRGRGYAPRVAILDGDVMATLPSRPMIFAALDALSHAYEALWSIRASVFTDALAVAAAREIRGSLPGALAGDAESRQRLIEASAMANYACGNSELAMAHALASAPRVHLPHGYQTGVLLPHVAAWVGDLLRPQARTEVDQLTRFYEIIGFRETFAPDEISEDQLESMVAAGLKNPIMANDPRSPSAEDLRRLLRRAGAGEGSASSKRVAQPVVQR